MAKDLLNFFRIGYNGQDPHRVSHTDYIPADPLHTPWRSGVPMRLYALLSRQKNQGHSSLACRGNLENQGASAPSHPAQVLPRTAYRSTCLRL